MYAASLTLDFAFKPNDTPGPPTIQPGPPFVPRFGNISIFMSGAFCLKVSIYQGPAWNIAALPLVNSSIACSSSSPSISLVKTPRFKYSVHVVKAGSRASTIFEFPLPKSSFHFFPSVVPINSLSAKPRKDWPATLGFFRPIACGLIPFFLSTSATWKYSSSVVGTFRSYLANRSTL
ncbi:hypothetical protein D3C78_1424040 [compost metagenome]